MTKTIDTLVEDIYNVLGSGTSISEEDCNAFTRDLVRIIKSRISEPRDKASYLRISNLGKHCDRQLWLSINASDKAESLEPHVLLKFLIGDMWESILLFLARVSGHKVQGEQDEIELHGVKGHRDAVIDGTVVDAKSASTFSYQKFEDGLTHSNDSFGYLTQLNSYLTAAQNDPLVTNKDYAAFLVGDKTLGHVLLDKHPRREINYEALIEKKQEMLKSPKLPPRGYPDEPDANGNRKLGVECSYCPFKKTCWPELRAFAYSGKPRFLTVVKKEPRNKYGPIQEISL